MLCTVEPSSTETVTSDPPGGGDPVELTVRATGKSLSDVVPAGLFLPGAAAGYLLVGKAETKAPAMSAPPPQQRATSPGLSAPKKK